MTQQKNYDMVQWYEGMLLAPQHFQYQDQRIHDILSFYNRNMHPFFWGIHHVSLDKAMLEGGRMRVKEVQGIMPDGLVFCYDASSIQSHPLECDLLDWETQHPGACDGDGTLVFLTLPQQKDSLHSHDRYHPSEKTHHNGAMHTEHSTQTIATLCPRLRLVPGEHLPGYTVGFPLARIKKSGNIFCCHPFHPACLTIDKGSLLGQELAKFIQEMRQKIHFLSQHISIQGRSLISKDAEFTVKLLSGGLMALEVLLLHQSSPWLMYQELVRFAGQSWGIDTHRPLPCSCFSPYKHVNIYPLFMDMIAFVRTMVERVQSHYDVMSCVKKDNKFEIFLEKSFAKKNLVIGLRRTHSMHESDLVAWLSQAVIASEKSLDQVREQRIIGASRTIIDADHTLQLSPSQDMILAHIDVNPSYINFDDTLVLFHVGDTPETRPVEIVLYIQKG